MIGIISDIHGNYAALSEVLYELDNMNISEIYCLGDVVGYYTQINECCNELRRRNVKCLMGNHDWYMLAKSFCPRSKSVNDCLAYQKKIITDENLEWISTFSLYYNYENVFMLHGGWSDPIDEYLEPSEEYFCKLEGNIFFSGHTHIQQLCRYGDKTYCNPGSVGQPRDNDNRAAFAVIDKEKIDLCRVEYCIEIVGQLMEEAGFSGYYYGCLKSGAPNLGWDKQNAGGL